MAGKEMLFACTHCHSRHPFEDLSKEEQLCKACRRKYPLVPCSYCQMEYHIIKKVSGSAVCSKCSQNVSVYGLPKKCKYCQVKAAFKQSYCARCMKSQKRYGEPIPCQGCKKKCAFNKSSESRAKVGGKILCLHCTLEYKKDRHKQQKLQTIESKFDAEPVHFGRVKSMPSLSGRNNEFKTSSEKVFRSEVGEKRLKMGASEKVIAPLKAENLAMSFKSRMDSVDSRPSSRSNSPFVHSPKSSNLSESNNHSKMDPSYGDHMSEITKLRDEIAMLKKVILQKEKIILEKDKKINEYNAEKWDKGKASKSKIQAMQREFESVTQRLKQENNELKKQVHTLSKRKSNRLERASRIKLEVTKLGTPQTPTERSETTSFSDALSREIKSEYIKKSLDGDFEKDGEKGINTDAKGTPDLKEEAKESTIDESARSGETTVDISEMNAEKNEVTDTGVPGVELDDKNEPSDIERKDDVEKSDDDLKPEFVEALKADPGRLYLQDAEGEYSSSGMEDGGSEREMHRRKRKFNLDDDDDCSSSGIDDSNEKSIKNRIKKKRSIVGECNDDEEDLKQNENTNSELEISDNDEGNNTEKNRLKKNLLIEDEDELDDETMNLSDSERKENLTVNRGNKDEETDVKKAEEEEFETEGNRNELREESEEHEEDLRFVETEKESDGESKDGKFYEAEKENGEPKNDVELKGKNGEEFGEKAGDTVINELSFSPSDPDEGDNELSFPMDELKDSDDELKIDVNEFSDEKNISENLNVSSSSESELQIDEI